MKLTMSGKDNCDATSSGVKLLKMQLVSKKTFEWRIDEFNRISKNPSDINAQTIKFDVDACSELPAMTWTLSLSHRFSSPNGRVHVDLNYLCYTKGGLRQIPMYVATVSLFGESLSSNLGRAASGYLEIMKAKAWTRKGGVKAYNWTGALVRGVLAFEFTVEFYIDRDTIAMRSAVESWNKLNEHSSKAHFLEMLKSGHLSDITIVAKDGQAFEAHKLILNAGSEVFEAMFRHEMTESTTGVITLDDMSATAVKFLLHFLYSFEVLPMSANEDDSIDEVVTLTEVLYLASKYGFYGLVKHLENNIENVCVERNVVYLLRLCKLYSLDNGVKKIFDLVKKNQWNALDEFVVSQL